MLRDIFNPASAAAFVWQRRETTRGRAANVYSYTGAQAGSKHLLVYLEPCCSATATVPFHGEVYIDLETSRTLRLTIEADDIPPNFPLHYSSMLVEYSFVDLSGRQFLLPTYAEMCTSMAKRSFKNQIEFHNYRKFDVSSSIHFDGDKNRELDPAPALTPMTRRRGRGTTQRWRTVEFEELNRLEDETPKLISPPPPSEKDRLSVIAEARANAVSYSATMPACTYTDSFGISVRSAGDSVWTNVGGVTLEAKHLGPSEQYKVSRTGGVFASQATGFENTARTATWDAEFQKLLENVLAPDSKAEFQWDRWITLRKRITHVYSFYLRATDSRFLAIENGNGPVENRSAVVAMHGFIYVDADSRRLVRIFATMDDIPSRLDLTAEAILVDFDFTNLAGRKVLLPLRAIMRVDSKDQSNRYRSTLRSYAGGGAPR